MLVSCVIEASVYLLSVIPVKFYSYMQLYDAFVVLTEEIKFSSVVGAMKTILTCS